MKQWEYLFVPQSTDVPARAMDQLNVLGADGWEVCAVDYGCWVLKRPKQS